MATTDGIPCPPADPPSQTRPPLKRLGGPDAPVRVLAFAGGGFDTTVQLGVTHALLVSRRAPPDMVIGCSAGAISAVALAEVLQAGEEAARVARFREILEGYMTGPGKILYALKPDTFQIDTERPLAPVKLPIHQSLERDHRLDALDSRAGLVNLYNTLLSLSVTVATATRAIRRCLGIMAAGQIRNGWRRWGVRVVEGFRFGMLLAEHLFRAASVIRVALLALVFPRAPTVRGATAAELIFRWQGWARLRPWLGTVGVALLLMALWVGLGAVVLGAAVLLGLIVTRAVGLLLPGSAALLALPSPGEAVIAAALIGALVAAVVALPIRSGWFRRFGRGVWHLAVFVGLLAVHAVFLALTSGILAAGAVAVVMGPAALSNSGGQTLLSTALVIVAVILAVAAVLLVFCLVRRRDLGAALLGRHGIARSVFPIHPLREVLINLFNPDYYGHRPVEEVVDEALGSQPALHGEDPGRGSPSRMDAHPDKKLLEHYAMVGRSPAIHVGLTVANVANGEFSVLPGTWTVIDGLLAATAAPPFFPGFDGADGILIDGAVIANEPTRPLFRHLRRATLADGRSLVDEEATEIQLYSVAALPVGTAELGVEPEYLDVDGQPKPYTDLVDIVQRALQLRHFRDATLERRLTTLNTRAMETVADAEETGQLEADQRKKYGVFYEWPAEEHLPADLRGSKQRRLLRTQVFAIEPEHPLGINERIFAKESERYRRRIVAEAVADGCRAALEKMLGDEIAERKAQLDKERQLEVDAGGKIDGPLQVEEVKCADLVKLYRGPKELPGGGGGIGPGLVEVCRHCVLARPTTGSENPNKRCHLRAGTRQPDDPPSWPRQGQEPPPRSRQIRVTEFDQTSQDRVRGMWRGKWPADLPGAASGRPTVSLLFSGGVFRGVFQMGVLNALSELHIRPDVIGGASVGSITAAMVARTFIAPKLAGVSAESPEALSIRRDRVRALAATYLGIDRLILTDRFADFVRSFTVRAAGARISVRDFDRVLRRFDEANPWTFNREFRSVVAGIERFLYVSPYELNDLVRAFRMRKHAHAIALLRRHFQELLDRMAVANEILGAEPLARLIRDHVLAGLGDGPLDAIPLGTFLDRGICFLATTTNLTQGRLEILGAKQLDPDDLGKKTRLLEALLASSAFPGVFRPRWSWEVFPESRVHEQYIDGGVIDNLPVDAVAQFLHDAVRMRLIEPRPAQPHLVFCASLEVQPGKLTSGMALEQLRGYWPGLLKRARQLGYNQKLDVFRRTQQNLRVAFARRTADGVGFRPGGPADSMLALDVLTVIPRWLCGTFAFHPMLGFRREEQARSIAHGCASTLLTFARLAHERPETAAAWRVGLREPEAAAAAAVADTFTPVSGKADYRPGDCWFRPGSTCPFSAEGQSPDDPKRLDSTGKALERIYVLCGDEAAWRRSKPKTHRARNGGG